MAKVTQQQAESRVTQQEEEARFTMDDLYGAFSAEEMAEFFDTTGQAANVRQSIPILKVNYCDIADKEGREIRKGNWVINQNSSELEIEIEEDGQKIKETRVEDIGIDLGKTVNITVLSYGFRYSYFPKDKDKKKFCSSQLVFDRYKETAIGSRLQVECGKKCPMRAEDRDQKDRCACQWVIFVRVPMPDGTKLDAMLYAKGSSYIPFSDYCKSAGTIPLFFCPTKLTTKMEREGSVTYYIMGFELLKDQPYAAIEVKENAVKAKAQREGAEIYKQQQLASRKGKDQALIAGKSEGLGATLVTDDTISGDIAFD